MTSPSTAPAAVIRAAQQSLSRLRYPAFRAQPGSELAAQKKLIAKLEEELAFARAQLARLAEEDVRDKADEAALVAFLAANGAPEQEPLPEGVAG